MERALKTLCEKETQGRMRKREKATSPLPFICLVLQTWEQMCNFFKAPEVKEDTTKSRYDMICFQVKITVMVG